MNSFITGIASDFKTLFYPDLCHICERNSSVVGQNFCVKCLADLRPTDYNHIADNPFIQHFYGRLPVVYGACLYHFSKEGTVRQLLHAIKYRKRREIGRHMGKQLGNFLFKQKKWRAIDYIVPVPLHPKKKRIRGYNQCQLLVEGMSDIIQRPIASVLERKKFSISQTKKGRAGRVEALNGVFGSDRDTVLSFKKVLSIDTPHFLIVDDVMTTGATLEACSLALLEAFPEAKLSLATLAMGRMT